ncbi:MAG: DUF4860 domain-containing protein [Clostridia bacterium]|nr:DUF4860 domain-containing protein [Clostridia bacterium]
MPLRKLQNHAMSGVFVFLILGMFAVISTVMVLLGAKVYRATAERSGVHNSARITSSYLRSMLRADDEAGVLKVETVDGVETIALLNTYDEDSYITRLYVYDGMLREWFTDATLPFEPENGEPVCEAEAMTASIEGQLLTIRIRVDGEWSEVYYALKAPAE